MKFGKHLRAASVREWAAFNVDYKGLKKLIKEQRAAAAAAADGGGNAAVTQRLFEQQLAAGVQAAVLFAECKAKLLHEYMAILHLRVNRFTVPLDEAREHHVASLGAPDDDHGGDGGDGHGNEASSAVVPVLPADDCSDMLFACKTLHDLQRELAEFERFIDLNQTAVVKITKKFDKNFGTALGQSLVPELRASPATAPLYANQTACAVRSLIGAMRDRLAAPPRPLTACAAVTKVYTIGCFDLFHRGHESMLATMRQLGAFLVVGIHDDESYRKLKGSLPVDPLPVRLRNVKRFADQVYVIPDTDPSTYIEAMVSPADVAARQCCYVRGEDMPEFPGRAVVQRAMPIVLLPRFEGVSSSLIRHVALTNDKRAVLAQTDALGRPRRRSTDEDDDVRVKSS